MYIPMDHPVCGLKKLYAQRHLNAIQILPPVFHVPGFLAARSLSLLSVLLTMATLKPSLAHWRTHDMPVPGPTPNTTQTLEAMIHSVLVSALGRN